MNQIILSGYTLSRRRRTTVSLETFPLILWIGKNFY